MTKIYMIEVITEMGGINRVLYGNKEEADKNLDLLKSKMGTRYGKNAEEVVEIISKAERVAFVAGKITSASIIDLEDRRNLEAPNREAVDKINNEAWIKQTKSIVDAGLGDYIKR